MSELGLCYNVSKGLLERLRIDNLFSMQAAVARHIMSHRDRDVVLCAPTGSGKTLAYALPVVSVLSNRVVARLRAVIVVPTRDLAAQIYNVFLALAFHTNLVIVFAVGATSTSREADSVCKADVLIATPGRLVEHTKNNSNFSLQSVEFLVLDESDRLLQDSFYSWVEIVVPHCGRRRTRLDYDVPTGLAAVAIHPTVGVTASGESKPFRKPPLMILASATQTRNPKRLAMLSLQRPKVFITSAMALQELDAKNASFSGSEDYAEKYCVPDTLVEKGYVLQEAREKPVALAMLLGMKFTGNSETSMLGTKIGIQPFPLSGSRLIFTNSVESSHRLARLLEILTSRTRSKMTVLEISGNLPAERRSYVVNAIAQCKGKDELLRQSRSEISSEKCIVVVSSDVLARGMDMTSVDVVINYDAPIHGSTYLHRVGRTARAGRSGTAVTMLLSKQARHFKRMARSIDRGSAKLKLNNINWVNEEFNQVLPEVEIALRSMKRILRREQLGLILTDACLPDHVLLELGVRATYRRRDREGQSKMRTMDQRQHVQCQRRMHIESGAIANEGDAIMAIQKHNEFDAATLRNENIVDDTGLSDESLSDCDSFSDFIAAQIAHNFLSRELADNLM